MVIVVVAYDNTFKEKRTESNLMFLLFLFLRFFKAFAVSHFFSLLFFFSSVVFVVHLFFKQLLYISFFNSCCTSSLFKLYHNYEKGLVHYCSEHGSIKRVDLIIKQRKKVKMEMYEKQLHFGSNSASIIVVTSLQYGEY